MSRQRLTITLDRGVLKHLDRVVDGMKIRNRSHAIEYLLQKSFAPKVTRALILAGGKGLSMRPFTYEMPKCLLPVGGRPLLEHTIDLFRFYEIRDLFISIGFLGERIKDHFGNGSRFGVRIQYIDQHKAESGTTMPVKQARRYLTEGPFVLYYGDVLADINLRDLIDFHRRNKSLATMALTSVAKSSEWGVVALQGAKILNFAEKPIGTKVFSHLINAGIYVLEQEVFNYISDQDKKLEDAVISKLAKDGKLYGYAFEGKWFDVGTPEIYERALKEWKGHSIS